VTLPRRLRFAADRSQLIIITGALVMVVAFFGFTQLAVEKSAALVANERAQNKVDQLEEQQQLLRAALTQAQRGQHVAPKAYQYFGKAPPGLTVIVPEEPVIIASPAAEEAPTALETWLNRIELTVSDGVTRLRNLTNDLVNAIERRRAPIKPGASAN
jgi:hypothetical protein